jgi:hypothetical protein
MDPIYKANLPQTLSQLEILVIKMKNALQDDYRKGWQSNNPRRFRSQKNMEQGGGYFANNVKWTIIRNGQKRIPIAFIANVAPNAMKFEASHGNMARILQQFGQGS